MMNILLKYSSVDVNVADNRWGNSPLHYAVSRGEVDMMRRLLVLNANPNAVNREGNINLIFKGAPY